MVPQRIERYLRDRGVSYRASGHPYRATAQEIASSAHISGKRFAKTVVLKLRDGQFALALLPADEWVDLAAFGDVLGADVDLASEEEFATLFPDCEVGAMPPFGGLYGLPVCAHACLARLDRMAVNGGTHTDVIELGWDDYVSVEHPRLIED
jgi:Ala-tRNA(Pro) deacylase